MRFDRISVVGAGAWGTALANAAARNGRTVTLLARNDETARNIARQRENPRLPGVLLYPRLTVTGDPACVSRADAVLLAVPAQAMREAASRVAANGASGPLIACAKGIERDTGCFMTQVIADVAPGAPVAILSGPSFALDVGRGLPTAVTLACADASLAASLAADLSAPTLRIYHTSDVRGVEIGGAAKNVLAIAAGIVVGRKLGASALAALTTRGFAELLRFGLDYDARVETLTGLSGLGDLILTCSTAQSRNFAYGIALGGGRPADGKLAEGAFTAAVLIEMATERGIVMPISTAVAAVLAGEMSVDAAIEALLTRPLRAET